MSDARERWQEDWRRARWALSNRGRITWWDGAKTPAEQCLAARGAPDPLEAASECRYPSGLATWRAWKAWRAVDDSYTYSEWKQQTRARSLAMQALASAARGGGDPVEILRGWLRREDVRLWRSR